MAAPYSSAFYNHPTSLQNQLGKVSYLLEHAAEEIDDLEAKLAQALEDLQDAKDELSDLRDEMYGLRSDMHALEMRNSELESEK